MRTDHDDDPAIAAWDAYSAAHKGYVDVHGSPDEHEPHVADDIAEGPAARQRGVDPALSLTIDRTVDTIGTDQPAARKARQSDG
jgi:hypothetical protein